MSKSNVCAVLRTVVFSTPGVGGGVSAAKLLIPVVHVVEGSTAYEPLVKLVWIVSVAPHSRGRRLRASAPVTVGALNIVASLSLG